MDPEVKVTNLKFPTEKINASPTIEAIQQAQQFENRSIVQVDNLLWEMANGTAFDPLSESLKAELSERYESDLIQIRKEFQEI